MKEKNEKLFYEQKTKETKERIKNSVSIMQNIKKLYDEVDKERDQYVNNVNEKAAEILKGIDEKINFKESDLEEL